MTRPLTIVNLTEIPFIDMPGGAGRLAYDLCRWQVKWGYKVYLVGLKTNPRSPLREDHQGITVVRVLANSYPSPDPRNFFGKLSLMRKAVKSIRRETGRIDIVHSHFPIGALAASSLNSRETLKIHSIHSPWLEEIKAGRLWEADGNRVKKIKSVVAEKFARRMEAKCLRGADVISSDSSFTKEKICEQYPRAVQKKKFLVLPGWVDVNKFTPNGPRTDWTQELGHRPKGPVFFTVRALVPRNGLEMLLKAAEIVKQDFNNFALVIGGRGPLFQKLQSLIQDSGLQQHVRLLGRIPEERLPTLYRSCDCFVLPTIALECFGIITLEALASGKPVIATPVGAIPEVLGPIYPEGLLPEVSAQALAAKMGWFIKEFGSRPFPGETAERFRKYVTDNYSEEIGVGRFKRLYESA